MLFKRLFSSTSGASARSYKAVVTRRVAAKPEYKVGDVKPQNLYVPKELPKYPEYKYGEYTIFKKANKALLGGQVINFGKQYSEFGNKSSRTWKVNVQKKKLWSETLEKVIPLTLSTRVLKTITKEGGLDNYLLKDKAARIKELGPLGWKLKFDILSEKLRKEKLQKETERVEKLSEGQPAKVFYEAAVNGENVKLTVGKRRLIKELFPLVKADSVKLSFEQFSTGMKGSDIQAVVDKLESYGYDFSKVTV